VTRSHAAHASRGSDSLAGTAKGQRTPPTTAASDPPLLWRAGGDWGSLEFRQVQSQAESSLWNELIQRYHYLKY